MKTLRWNLFAFLLLSLLAGGGCDGGSAPVAQASPAVVSKSKFASATAFSTEERVVFDLVNSERTKRGLAPFRLRMDLVALARAHSVEQAARGTMTHRDRRGTEVDGRMDRAGISWNTCGENVGRNKGFGDPAAAAVKNWMESPPHKKNILRREYVESGLGAMRSTKDGYWYFTQVFLRPE